MKPVRKCGSAFWALIVLLCAGTAGAAIPGADDPKGYTYHDLCKAKVDFNQRTLTQAYKTFGKHDPKWDAAAVKLLDGMTLWFSYAYDNSIYQIPNVPTTEQCLALSKAAIDAGCDDPLVLYCAGSMYCNLDQAGVGAPVVKKSVNGLIERKYPDVRIAAAISWRPSAISSRRTSSTPTSRRPPTT